METCQLTKNLMAVALDVAQMCKITKKLKINK